MNNGNKNYAIIIYDSINRDVMLEILALHGIPEKVVGVTKAM